MNQSSKNRPRILIPIRFVIFALIYGLLAACPAPRAASIIFNNTDAPVTVTYTMRLFLKFVEGNEGCPLEIDSYQRPRIRQGKPKGNIWAGDPWEKVPWEYANQKRCRVKFELAPGYSAIVYETDICSDYKEYLNGGQFESTLERLRIQTQDGVVDFTDWETAKQFTRVNKHICLLELN